MKSNPSNKSLGKTLTKIINVMRNIGLTTALYRTTSTPEKLGSTIEKMSHDLPTKWSRVSNGFSDILSEHRNFYCQYTFMPIVGKYMLRENGRDFT